MPHHDLLVIGELNPDLILTGDVEPAFGQVERILDGATMVLGSSGAITAAGAARLGLRVGYAGAVGRDAFGAFVLGELEHLGIDVRHVVVRDAGATGLTCILARSDGDRAIYTHPGVM